RRRAFSSPGTTRLRFGPLVWPMPLHHPLRLIEEICMLDQMSGGRLDIGFGRGAAPIELEYYGVAPQDGQEIYAEAGERVLKGLTQRVLDLRGRRFWSGGVPMDLEPLQKPHPPIWYGLHAPESAERAARRGLNVVSLDPTNEAWLAIDRYRTIWRQVRAPASTLPSSASAASSSWRRATPRHWRWPAAPTSSGTRASPTCSAGTDARSRIPGRQASICLPRAGRVSPRAGNGR